MGALIWLLTVLVAGVVAWQLSHAGFYVLAVLVVLSAVAFSLFWFLAVAFRLELTIEKDNPDGSTSTTTHVVSHNLED
jgi:hypothetical protein